MQGLSTVQPRWTLLWPWEGAVKTSLITQVLRGISRLVFTPGVAVLLIDSSVVVHSGQHHVSAQFSLCALPVRSL